MSGARAVGTRTRATARVLLVLLAVVLAGSLQRFGLGERVFHPGTRFPVGQAKEVQPGLRLEFQEPRIGSSWAYPRRGPQARTSEVFLVVPVRMELSSGQVDGLVVTLRGGDGHTYSSKNVFTTAPKPWTRCTDAAVFLLPWSALAGSSLDFRLSDRAQFYNAGGIVPLGLTDQKVAELEPFRDGVALVDDCDTTKEPL